MTADPDLLSSYTFALPPERIADRPAPRRSDARLLVVAPQGPLEHRRVGDLPALLAPGDLVIVNDTSVIPARLFGEKAGTGGKVEVLLVRRAVDDDRTWVCLVNASKRPKPGARLVFPAGATDAMMGEVVGDVDDEAGAMRVRFHGDALAFARRFGHVPLPPYIARSADAEDALRYQTVFSDPDKAGSSAAPTAGLHFDQALLDALRARGVSVATVTLHVGPGTFLPVRSARLSEHTMHPEPWWLPQATADAIAATRARGGRVIAVGTTTLRTLESAARDAGDAPLAEASGLTRLFVTPGFPFRVVDGLVTNFHLPESTLFVLVCAFAGVERMRAAYQAAIDDGYRFYSYGDASLLWRR